MRNRIIAVLFIIAIFSVGGLTALRSGELSAWGKSIVSDFSKENIVRTEASMDKSIVYRMKWINVNGLFKKYFGVTGDLQKKWYRLDNGGLMYSLPYQSDKRLAGYARRVYFNLAFIVSNVRTSVECVPCVERRFWTQRSIVNVLFNILC